MTSIVVLDGILGNKSSNSIENEPTWSGTWHFSKEKRLLLTFNYVRKSSLVPRDIFNYVSFIPTPEESAKISESVDITIKNNEDEAPLVAECKDDIQSASISTDPVNIPSYHPLVIIQSYLLL